jgi:hypothetical protein
VSDTTEIRIENIKEIAGLTAAVGALTVKVDGLIQRIDRVEALREAVHRMEIANAECDCSSVKKKVEHLYKYFWIGAGVLATVNFALRFM